MNKRFYTSIEQSKKLLELGLSADSADMYYMETHPKSYNVFLIQSKLDEKLLKDAEHYNTIPCWSLSALLELMPKCIIVGGGNYFSYIATLDTISYGDVEGHMVIKFSSESLIEATYNMIIWLLENGYLKKGE